MVVTVSLRLCGENYFSLRFFESLRNASHEILILEMGVTLEAGI